MLPPQRLAPPAAPPFATAPSPQAALVRRGCDAASCTWVCSAAACITCCIGVRRVRAAGVADVAAAASRATCSTTVRNGTITARWRPAALVRRGCDAASCTCVCRLQDVLHCSTLSQGSCSMGSRCCSRRWQRLASRAATPPTALVRKGAANNNLVMPACAASTVCCHAIPISVKSAQPAQFVEPTTSDIRHVPTTL